MIGLATALPGAAPFKFEDNINETYRGTITTDGTDLKRAFIKELDLQQLCNEVLASELAQLTGLPVPETFLCLVPTGVLPTSKAPALDDASGHIFLATVDANAPSLWHFYSKTDPSAYVSACQRLVNWSQLGDLYGFDIWLANVDRHQGNLLFDGARVFLIDHGHCFSGPIWSPSDLDPAQIYQNKLRSWLTPYIKLDRRPQVAKQACALPQTASEPQIRLAMKGCRADVLLPVPDIEALISFLSLRASDISSSADYALCLTSGGVH